MPSSVQIILDHVEENEISRIMVRFLAALLYSEGFSVDRFIAEGEPYLAGFLSAAAEDFATMVSDDVLASAQAFLQEIDLLGGALSEADRRRMIQEALERVSAGLPETARKIEAGFAEWVNGLRRAGMDDESIMAALMADPAQLKRILGGLETELADIGRQFVTVLDDVVYETALETRLEEGEAEGFDIRSHVWISVHDRNVCGKKLPAGEDSVRISCWHRHGKVKVYSEWRRMGLPGAGVTLCRKRCRCRVIPKSYLKEGIPESSVKATEAIEAAQKRAEDRQQEVRDYWREARGHYGNS